MLRIIAYSDSPEMSRDQKQWAEAMDFCDSMELEAKADKNTVAARWWAKQAEACYSRIQRNIPYIEDGI